MLHRCPYEDGHVCCKVGWLAHPVPGHGKKSGYAPACDTSDIIVILNEVHNDVMVMHSKDKIHIEPPGEVDAILARHVFCT